MVERIYLPAIPEIGITFLRPTYEDLLSTKANLQVPCSYAIGMHSLVLRVDVGGARFLFTGDIVGKEEDEYGGLRSRYNEADLVSECAKRDAKLKIKPPLLKSDVLIVPHHGDDTSSTTAFINAVNPTFALISTDERLRPTRESVLQRYKDAHAQVLTTSATPHPWNDNIVCRRNEDGKVACSYEDAIPPGE